MRSPGRSTSGASRSRRRLRASSTWPLLSRWTNASASPAIPVKAVGPDASGVRPTIVQRSVSASRRSSWSSWPRVLLGGGLLGRRLATVLRRRRGLGRGLLGRPGFGSWSPWWWWPPCSRSSSPLVRGRGLLGGSSARRSSCRTPGGPPTPTAQGDPGLLQHVVHEAVRAARVLGDLANALARRVPLGVLGRQRGPLRPVIRDPLASLPWPLRLLCRGRADAVRRRVPSNDQLFLALFERLNDHDQDHLAD